MSETVKLIIEISKEDIELIRKTSFVEDERTLFKQNPSDRQGTMMLFRLMDSVKDGVPLDDVKAEIRGMEYHTIDGDILVDYEEVLDIVERYKKEGAE